MYFPFLRGKQYELLALRELIDQDIINKNIIPIIEPVKTNLANLNRALEKFVEKKLPFVLIINPQVGDLVNDPISLKNEFVKKKLSQYKKNFFVGFIITDKTRLIDVDNFFSAYHDYQICAIHNARLHDSSGLKSLLSDHKNLRFNCLIENSVGRDYRDKIRTSSSKIILIEDNFSRKRNNSDYGDTDYFSVLYDRYSEYGFDGFGDFLTIGNDYSDTGGPAYAVAIHLSELVVEEIWIRHFVSDSNDTPVDPAGKFYEALRKLVRYIDNNRSRFDFSYSCKEYRLLFKQKKFPGLGYVKKLSIQHHFELINSLI